MISLNYNLLLLYFLIDFLIQIVGWIIGVFFKTEKFYDLFGSLTFITLSFISYEWSSLNKVQFIQSHMIMLWACRLGVFLFLRVLKDGKDKRFDNVRNNPSKFLVYWMLQGVWVFITILPSLLLNNINDSKRFSNKHFGYREYIGWSLWLLGLVIETVADAQKSVFRSNPDNKDKFISSGVWSISRHPNYLGEIILWFGLYLSASAYLRGIELLSILSPIFVYLLITKISGIPLLEKAAKKKWGNLPQYQEYLQKTPILIPFIHH